MIYAAMVPQMLSFAILTPASVYFADKYVLSQDRNRGQALMGMTITVGGISAQPVLVDAIRKQLKKLYSICPYVVPEAEVVACKFQNDANLFGALQCYLADFVW